MSCSQCSQNQSFEFFSQPTYEYYTPVESVQNEQSSCPSLRLQSQCLYTAAGYLECPQDEQFTQDYYEDFVTTTPRMMTTTPRMMTTTPRIMTTTPPNMTTTPRTMTTTPRMMTTTPRIMTTTPRTMTTTHRIMTAAQKTAFENINALQKKRDEQQAIAVKAHNIWKANQKNNNLRSNAIKLQQTVQKTAAQLKKAKEDYAKTYERFTQYY